VRIHLGRRDQPFFDHRDPLADFELAHARSGQRRDNGRGERPDNGNDWNEKRPCHEGEIVHVLIRLAELPNCFTAKQFR
jgi:hypothetical protein